MLLNLFYRYTRYKSIIVVLLIILLLPFYSQARWVEYEDAIKEINFYNETININEDGTNSSLVEVEETILKEAGRAYAARYTLIYNGDSSKITVLEAKTTYNNKEYRIDKSMIEDKPLASSHQGFDQQRQILIAFPKAEIGAKIYIKYLRKEAKVFLDGFYADYFEFGNNGYWSKALININSELPLNITVNDPKKVLKIKKSNNNNKSHIEMKLTKPHCTDTINEPPLTTVMNSKHLTWASISSLSEWKDLAIMLGKDYTKVINQPLPKQLQPIANKASTKNIGNDQINEITSSIIDKIQYMGDWRTVSGRYAPRDLEKIANTQIGDCKDLSSTVAAILKNLGYKAQVALVNRGIMTLSYLNTLPDLGNFNHAFLKVIDKTGKVYWVDPTNDASMANGIFPDIADKMALILDPLEPSYEKTPSVNPQHSQLSIDNELIVKEQNTTINQGKLILQGESAIDLTGASLQSSKQTIADLLFFEISGTHLEEKEKKSITTPDLSSRIVNDLTFTYTYEQKNKLYKSNLGQAFLLNAGWLKNFTDVASDQVSDIIIGPPVTLKSRILIKGVRAENIERLNYEANSPWLYVKRECENKDNNIEIINTIIIFTTFITNEELKTSIYKQLKDNLEKNLNKSIIVFSHAT